MTHGNQLPPEAPHGTIRMGVAGNYLLSALVPPVPAEHFHQAASQVAGPEPAPDEIAYDSQDRVRAFGFLKGEFGTEPASRADAYARYNEELGERIGGYDLYDGQVHDTRQLALEAAARRAELARIRAEIEQEARAWKEAFGFGESV